MKKNLLNWMTILMVAIVCVGFVSCGGDDDDSNSVTDPSAIIGTWVKFYEKETKWVLSNGDWVKTSEDEDNNHGGQSAVYFGADGTYYQMYNYDGSWQKATGTIRSYSIQGNNLILSSSSTMSPSSKSRTFSISGTVLEITETELDGYEKEEEVNRYRKM